VTSPARTHSHACMYADTHHTARKPTRINNQCSDKSRTVTSLARAQVHVRMRASMHLVSTTETGTPRCAISNTAIQQQTHFITRFLSHQHNSHQSHPCSSTLRAIKHYNAAVHWVPSSSTVQQYTGRHQDQPNKHHHQSQHHLEPPPLTAPAAAAATHLPHTLRPCIATTTTANTATSIAFATQGTAPQQLTQPLLLPLPHPTSCFAESLW
jgi:hypothetical protein